MEKLGYGKQTPRLTAYSYNWKQRLAKRYGISVETIDGFSKNSTRQETEDFFRLYFEGVNGNGQQSAE